MLRVLACGFAILSLVAPTLTATAQPSGDSISIVSLASIDSGHGNYFPALTPDGKTLYFGCQMPKMPGRIFFVNQVSSGFWSAPKSVELVNKIGNVGSVAFDTLGNYYFSGPSTDGNSFHFSIWHLKESVVSILDTVLNSQSWQSQPTVTPDGQTMYFAQRIHGTKANVWLVVSHRQRDGSWSAPISLGSTINSQDYVGTPSIWRDNRTLFFSMVSKFGPRLFVSVRNSESDTSWSVPKELPSPINTSSSSFTPYLSADGHDFYFASNRDSGSGSVFHLFVAHLPHGIKDLLGSE